MAVAGLDHGLVGRDPEQEVLSGVLDATRDGRGQLVLLRGEAGMGKTTLLQAMLDRAEALDVLALRGAAVQDGGAPAYWPWIQVLRGLVRAAGKAPMERLTRLDRANLSHLVPEWASDQPGPDPTRFALLDSLSIVLAEAASTTPMVVVLDDLHAAGQASWLPLPLMAQVVGSVGLSIIVGYRDHDARLEPGVESVLSGLEKVATVISLTGLDDESVARLAARTAGRPLAPRMVADIIARTGGSPLFVTEVGRLLAGGQQGEGAMWPVPVGIRQAIERRLARVFAQPGTEVRGPRVLAVAAVIGSEFDAATTAAAAGVREPVVLDLLDQAAASGLVNPRGGTIGGHRFSHALVRDAILTTLSPRERAAHHVEVGRVLMATSDLDDPVPLARIAHHLYESLPVGDAEEAVRVCRLAAERFLRDHAYREAAVQASRALAAARRVALVDDALIVDLLLLEAEALLDGGEPAGAERSIRRATMLARRSDDGPRLARAALLATAHLDFNDTNRGAVKVLQEALASVGADDPLGARLAARLAVAGYHLGASEAVESADRAVALARRVGAPSALAEALSSSLHARWRLRPPAEARTAGLEIAAIARASGDLERAAEGHNWALMAHLDQGDLVAADGQVEAMTRLAEELRQPLHQLIATSRRATLATARGDYATALRLAHQTWEIGQRGGVPDADAVLWAQLFGIFTEHGLGEEDTARMEAIALRLAALSPIGPPHQAGVAVICALTGRLEEARSRLASLMSPLELTQDMVYVWTLCCLAVAFRHVGRTEDSQATYDLLLPFDGVCVAASGGVHYFGSASHHLGLLAAQAGRLEDAERHLAAATTQHATMGATGLWARSAFEHARVLARRDRPGDAARAQVLLDAVGRRAEALGIARLQDEVAAHRIAGPAERPAVRLSREGEVWALHHSGGILRMKHTKGLVYLDHLLAHPGQEVDAKTLLRLTQPAAPTEAPPPASGLEVLDATALSAYRGRLADIEAELEEAERFNDPERVAHLREERTFLAREVSAAVGLGGRVRVTGSDAERARLNVTRAIRSAVNRLRTHAPDLADALDRDITTGRACRYR